MSKPITFNCAVSKCRNPALDKHAICDTHYALQFGLTLLTGLLFVGLVLYISSQVGAH